MGLVCLVFLFFVLVFVKMGQGSSASVCSLLQCFLKNFQDFKKRAGDYGYDVNAFDLQRFCEREWPTFQVGWPDAGSFDMTTAYRVHHVIYDCPGHPDQIPYIQVWVDVLSEKPQWMRACLPRGKLGQRQTILLAGPQKRKGSPGPSGRAGRTN
uniref:Gamma-retroviral matrix protein domain-containing protein n=1 Tax=Myotis myotis TaxID=51298 RepID=A0A7J7RTB3_MYOMY|nr:hypothetical protein mMyoMyo1_010187 [Myotis myotis]